MQHSDSKKDYLKNKISFYVENMMYISNRNLGIYASTRRAPSVAYQACQGRLQVIACTQTGQRHKEQNTVNPEDVKVKNTESSSSLNKYNWTFDNKAGSSRDDGRLVMDLPVALIRRPLGRTRGNDPEKVAALMESIKEIGLQEPIDVLEVDGIYYGFSGCHRFEAHQRLGAETIRCRVRKATKEVLKMHLM